jgi:hypothetical protein
VVYRGAVSLMGILVRPRTTLAALASAPRLLPGFAVVLGSGIVALALGLIANQIDAGGGGGALASLLLPVLFLVYWAAAALIVDAGAGLTARTRRLREYLAVSGFTFIPWIAYGALSVVEALAGSGSLAQSIVSWLTLPLLVWFLFLTTLAIQAVFDVSAFVALALAMLPDAVLLLVLIVLLVVVNA